MQNIIGVRFKRAGKIHYYDSQNINVKINDYIIGETVRGIEIGRVVLTNVDKKSLDNSVEIKPIIKKATEKDLSHQANNLNKVQQALENCQKCIKKHNLNMNLINCEYTFDNSKIIFYYTAEGRVDFRELVKDLAAVFKVRVELRQVGVRDEVKMIGGNGICGRELCCCTYLDNFNAVSIKNAKEQNISLTPSKISGICGRLMCCLKYEQEVYDEKLAMLPHKGAIIETVDGTGIVEEVYTLNEKLKIKFNKDDNLIYKYYYVKDVKVVKDNYTCNDETIPEELKKLEEE